ncbi:unnamed protein product [Trifolium pratense]|uniref:Uncharacterized protein n=1 Tax=Trifolium pratense TaxID=57577 RepID=A0ACB0LC98_TRIPR|nr:unnamed protein product [Trifolium pratense]
MLKKVLIIEYDSYMVALTICSTCSHFLKIMYQIAYFAYYVLCNLRFQIAYLLTHLSFSWSLFLHIHLVKFYSNFISPNFLVYCLVHFFFCLVLLFLVCFSFCLVPNFSFLVPILFLLFLVCFWFTLLVPCLVLFLGDSITQFNVSNAIKDSILVNFGECGLAASLGSFQVKYVNPITNMCIIRASREDYEKVWVSLQCSEVLDITRWCLICLIYLIRMLILQGQTNAYITFNHFNIQKTHSRYSS